MHALHIAHPFRVYADSFQRRDRSQYNRVFVLQYFQRTNRLADVNRRLKSQIWSSVVTIVLVEAKNLLPMDIDGLSDPYVKFRYAILLACNINCKRRYLLHTQESKSKPSSESIASIGFQPRNGKVQVKGSAQDSEPSLAGAVRSSSLRGSILGPGARSDGLGSRQEPPG